MTHKSDTRHWEKAFLSNSGHIAIQLTDWLP